MKKIMVLFLLLLGITTIAPAQEIQMVQVAKKKVALYVAGDVTSAYRKVIGSKMVSGITQSADYIAVERTADFLAALSKESNYIPTSAEIKQLGKSFGAHYVVIVDATQLYESIFISARMVDVETSDVLASDESSKEVKSMESLNSLVAEVAEKLLNQVNSTTIPITELIALGPFYSMEQLLNARIPGGYREVTGAELMTLIKLNKVKLPVYTNVRSRNNAGGTIGEAILYNSITNVQEISRWANQKISAGYIYIVKD